MYDLIVIGAGSGGLSAAINGIRKKIKVLLIEKYLPGGECTWSGCIPSKALINITKDIYSAKKYTDFDVDLSDIPSKVRGIISTVYSGETPDMLSDLGIDYVNGVASFKDSSTILVNNKEYKGKNIIISTGSKPSIPNINGLNQITPLTNDNIFTLDKFPESIVIIGAGTIGIEIGQSFNRLGISVDIIDFQEEIMPKEDQDFTFKLRKKLEQEGVNFHLGSNIKSVEKTDDGIKVDLTSKEVLKSLYAKKLFLATGRTPNTNLLKLENIGLVSGRYIEVDEYLESKVEGVYAIGDSATGPQFSHIANYQANLIIDNLTYGRKRRLDYSSSSWCTFTSPELASLGDINYDNPDSLVFEYDEKHLDRAKVKEDEIFKAKFICDSKGYLKGASILSERAGEIICEVQALMANNLPMTSLTNIIHPYPTYNEIFRKLGGNIRMKLEQSNKFLITAEEVKSNFNRYKFIDCRKSLSFEAGHIKGAIPLSWKETSKMDTDMCIPGWGLLKSENELKSIFSEKGIDPKDHFIVYTDTLTSSGEDARILWMLESLGIKGYILDGGWNSIKSIDLPLSKTPLINSTEVTPLKRNKSNCITTNDLRYNLNSYKILDAREPEEHNGEKNYGEVSMGKIPNSINIHFKKFYTEEGTFKSPQEIKELLNSYNISSNDKVVTYCTGGVRSSVAYYALKLAGFNNIINYDGSFAEWTACNLPLE